MNIQYVKGKIRGRVYPVLAHCQSPYHHAQEIYLIEKRGEGWGTPDMVHKNGIIYVNPQFDVEQYNRIERHRRGSYYKWIMLSNEWQLVDPKDNQEALQYLPKLEAL